MVPHLHVEAGRNPVHALLGEGVLLRSGERASLGQFDEPQLWSPQTCVLSRDHPGLSCRSPEVMLNGLTGLRDSGSLQRANGQTIGQTVR